MNAPAMSPPTRVSSSGPIPIPSRCSRVAGIVIEFHSPMSRMNSTLPDAVDGESVPNVDELAQRTTAASRRRTARRRPAPPRTAPAPAAARPRRTRSASAAGPTATPRRARPSPARRRCARASRCPRAAPRPRTRARSPAARAPRGTAPRRPAAGRARSCPAGPCTRTRARAARRGSPAPTCTIRGAPASRAISHASGAASDADERERQRGREARLAQQPDERHLDERRQRHPVGVGRDRQDRVRRDRPADLGEDPDEVDVEAVARRELPGHVHVVERVRVGRVREEGRRHHPRDEREQVQGDGNPHSRCSLAPGQTSPERYESARGPSARGLSG